MKNTDQLYFAWTGFQRRPVSMAPHFGFDTIFMPVERRVSKIRKIMTYLKYGWRTLTTLARTRPAVVWVQLPQVPLMWVALLYRSFFRRDAVVIADCHNAMFRPPWSKVPLGLSMLARCNIVLVHNTDVLEAAVQLGVKRARMMVVEDPPASFPLVGPFLGAGDMPHPWLVFPASFAQDEPVAELIEAARMTPNVSVLITGNVRNCREPDLIDSAPANVRFLGFLSRDDFEALIVGCDAVIAFTRFDGIQLSVCGEAVGAGKPMLISDTATLRRLFPDGTVFVNSSDPVAIASGVSRLLSNHDELSEEVNRFGQNMSARWMLTRGRPLLQRIGLVAA
jgi:hypothetical protein